MVRRSNEFRGNWIMSSKNGGYYDIESNENGLEAITHPNTEYWTFNGRYSARFDEHGDSWLFNSLSCEGPERSFQLSSQRISI